MSDKFEIIKNEVKFSLQTTLINKYKILSNAFENFNLVY